MCRWRIGACVPTPISPSSSRPECMPCCASARSKWRMLPSGAALSPAKCAPDVCRHRCTTLPRAHSARRSGATHSLVEPQEWYHQRRQVATLRAQPHMSMQMAVLSCKPVPGVWKA
jgi:hypothetical protein